MSKKSRANKAAKATSSSATSAASATSPATPATPTTPQNDGADFIPTPVRDTVTHTAAGVDVVAKPLPLPARAVKNSVKGEGASATFKGIGTMAEHGIPSGLRRNEFQDRVLEWNETSKAHLSDDDLAVIFDNEFPFGGVRIVDRPELVATIRKFYNAGKHGKQQQGVPTVQSLQYDKPKPKTAVPSTTDATDADHAPTAKSA